jgi:hypothetical protein
MVCIAIVGENDFPSCSKMTLLHGTGKEKHGSSLHENIIRLATTLFFDSGAISNMHFSKDGMENLKPLKIAIIVGNAENIYSEAIGMYKGLVTQKNGSPFPITLEDVLYIPVLYINLFSMMHVLKNKTVDFKREKGTIALFYEKAHKLLFDKIIQVGHG